MPVAANIICAWPDTNASIPANWSRETNLDGYYVQQAATSADADLSTVNGNANHGHSATSHTHNFSGAYRSIGGGWDNTTPLATTVQAHQHNATASAAADLTVQNTSDNDYLRLNVIFIKSNGNPTGFPDGCVAAHLGDSLPTDWARVNGNGFLKGATAGGNGSITPTGSSSHTHTADSHNHANTNSAAASNVTTGGVYTIGSQSFASTTHYHVVSFTSDVATIDNSTEEPVNRKLNLIRYTAGTNDFPENICAWWGGTEANIPADWSRVDSFDGDFYKGANADGESDSTTGGATTHSHTQSHNHTGSHSTSSACSNETNTLQARRGGSGEVCNHPTTWNVANNTDNITTSASEAHYPQYKKVILIEYSTGGAVIPQRTLVGAGI